MPAVDPHAPLLGPSGEPCAACGAPLAADQRYCVNCGELRGPRRLDPLEHARGRSRARESVTSPPAPPSRLPSPRIAGIATLLVLGFGIAAGTAAGPHADSTLASAPARRTVIVVQAPQPAATTTAVSAAGTSPDTSSPEASSSEASSPDTSSPDTSSADTSSPDTSSPDESGDTGSGDSGSGDTGSGDTGSGDTGSGDTGSGDTGSGNSDNGDSGSSPSDEPATPSVKHVWIVALTGHRMDEALANSSPMPYLSGTLRPKGLLLSGYKPNLPGGLANLIAMISGQRPTAEQRGNCPTYNDVDVEARTGCVFAKDVDTLPGQLTAVGKTWRAYVEDSDAGQPPDTCRHPVPGGPLEPVMARNPLLFFHSIIDTPDCAANTAGMSRLLPDTEDAESAPTLSLVVPNACHDGADQPCAPGAPAGATAADGWLKQQLDPLLASKAYKDDGMVVVTFDTGPDFKKPLGALVISDAVEAGGTDDGDYRPANLLRTFEDLFELDPLGRAKHVHAVTVTKPSR
jgi:hypothetical protein